MSSGEEKQATGYRERNSTAERALTILAMFSEERLALSAAEVAGELGVARSTAYRYLQSLVANAYLSEDGRGAFRLGARVVELARLARRGFGVSEAALPVMRALSQRFRQTVLLTKRAGSSVVCLEREEASDQFVRLHYERGTLLSLNAGASAQVLLAWLPEEQVRALVRAAPLERFTATTITDADAMVARMARIRADGYAISHGELDSEAVGMAAPIFSRPGEVAAGLSLVFIRSRVAQDAVAPMRDALVEAAREVSEALGGHDG